MTTLTDDSANNQKRPTAPGKPIGTPEILDDWEDPKAFIMCRIFPVEECDALERIMSGLEAAGFLRIRLERLHQHGVAAFKMYMGEKCAFRDAATLRALVRTLSATAGLKLLKKDFTISISGKRVTVAFIFAPPQEPPPPDQWEHVE